MSDDRNRVLDTLTDEGQPTGTVAEAVGISKVEAAQLLQSLAKDGLARCGRGGWRSTAGVQTGEVPVQQHHPAGFLKAPGVPSLGQLATHEPVPDGTRKIVARRAKAKRGRKPKLATVAALQPKVERVVATSGAPASNVTFALNAYGELLAIDGDKVDRWSAADTARLAAFFQIMAPVLKVAA